MVCHQNFIFQYLFELLWFEFFIFFLHNEEIIIKLTNQLTLLTVLFCQEVVVSWASSTILTRSVFLTYLEKIKILQANDNFLKCQCIFRYNTLVKHVFLALKIRTSAHISFHRHFMNFSINALGLHSDFSKHWEIMRCCTRNKKTHTCTVTGTPSNLDQNPRSSVKKNSLLSHIGSV